MKDSLTITIALGYAGDGCPVSVLTSLDGVNPQKLHQIEDVGEHVWSLLELMFNERNKRLVKHRDEILGNLTAAQGWVEA